MDERSGESTPLSSFPSVEADSYVVPGGGVTSRQKFVGFIVVTAVLIIV